MGGLLSLSLHWESGTDWCGREGMIGGGTHPFQRRRGGGREEELWEGGMGERGWCWKVKWINKLIKMILVGCSYYVQIYLLNLKLYSLRILYVLWSYSPIPCLLSDLPSFPTYPVLGHLFFSLCLLSPHCAAQSVGHVALHWSLIALLGAKLLKKVDSI